MIKEIALGLALTSLPVTSTIAASDIQEESDVRFAFYASSWGGNTLDKIRLLAYNSTEAEIRLDSVTFLKTSADDDQIELDLALTVPAGGYAEMEFDYVDLIQNNECIERTMAENWRLAEISNYTLNPSVRNLIIENTDSFRIYQCVESIHTQITQLSDNSVIDKEEWVLYHFESRIAP